MKTITELQAQLRESAARLERLSGDVAALQKKEAKKGLDFGRIETAGKRYPLSVHSMQGQASDLQQRYFTLIGAMLLLDCKRPENGWLFVQRLLTTAGCSSKLEALQAAAARLTIEQLDQTTKEIIEEELKIPMLMDLMLVYLACEGGKAAKDYIASIAELLGAHTEMVQEVAGLAVLIAQKNTDISRFNSLFEKGYIMDLSEIREYMTMVLPYFIERRENENENAVFLYGDGKTPIPQKTINNILRNGNSRTHIRIYDMVFAGTPLRFENRNSLLLDGCTIRDINISQQAFLCQNIKEVQIYDCCFDSFTSSDYTVDFRNIDTLRIEDSTLSNIRGTAPNSWTWYFSEIKQGHLEDVTAKGISGTRWMYNNSNSNLTAENCFYSQCSGNTYGLPAGFTGKEDL